MSRSVVAVAPGGDLPYAAKVLDAAQRFPVLVLATSADPFPSARLADLLTGPFDIGAVVPGQCVGPGQQIGPGQTQDLRTPRTNRDVGVVDGTQLAIRSSSLIRADLDPAVDDVERLIATVLSAIRAQGLRVVSEPTWCSEQPTWCSEQPPEADPLAPISRILVITGTLTDGLTRDEDRSADQLIASLIAQCRDSEITVLAVDRRWSERAVAGYRAQGVVVVDGPRNWDAWFDDRWGTFSHVFVTQGGMRSSARRWIDATQPQAAKILHVSTLAFRAVTALTAVTPADELAGLDHERIVAEARFTEQARWAMAVWCEDPRDESFVRGLLPDTPTAFIPPVIETSPAVATLDLRAGLAIIATEGHDMLGGNEDAALRALRTILPKLRLRDPDLGCTVVTDWPTPVLAKAVEAQGATIASRAELERVVRSARVVLCAHGWGTGGRSAVIASLVGATPFVATPAAVGGLELGSLAPASVFSVDEDLAAHAWRLLDNDAAWLAHTGAAATLLVDRYGADGRARALQLALAQLGITPGPAVKRWPVVRGLPASVRPRQWRGPSLRPPGVPPAPPLDGRGPDDPALRYQLWASRRSGTPSVLRALRADLATLTYRPKIAVVMPVDNTSAHVLRDAVDSVRAQIYPNWRLSIGDDASASTETAGVLRELEQDPLVTVSRLPLHSGISAATNAALAAADGEFVAFMDPNDVLKPHALAQVARWLNDDPALDIVYTDEDKLDGDGELFEPHFKPDWSPDQLMSQNYVSHLTVVRRTLVEAVGGLRPEFDGSQDHDLLLRLVERTDRIGHIPEPLYSRRVVAGSTVAFTDAEPDALDAPRRALADALYRRGYEGSVETTKRGGHLRARYGIPGTPRVSIIIPTRDRVDLLRTCVDSIWERSTYHNFELVVIDNQSSDGDTLAFLADFPGRVIHYPHRFNYARMMNLAARSVDADALLFLNNDTEVISPDWIEAMLEHAMRPEVGAVGGRLYYGNGEPQHEGILIGVCGRALNIDYRGYWSRGDIVRNTVAVTGACTMVRPTVYWEIGGNDERLRVAYNDVDLCLRIRQAGYDVVYTPYAELYHYESATRSGFEHHEDGPLFDIRWKPREGVDPYYSPLLSRDQLFFIEP